MQRIPTSFALSLWVGFLGVAGASELAQAAGFASFLGHPLDSPVDGGPGSFLVGMLTLGAALMMVASLVLVHTPDDARVRRGEMLGFAGVGISSAMVLSAVIFGAPFASVFDRLDLALWSVGLSLLALAFDNCVFAPDDEDDEMAFRRTVQMIDASIPRERDRRFPDQTRTGRDL